MSSLFPPLRTKTRWPRENSQASRVGWNVFVQRRSRRADGEVQLGLISDVAFKGHTTRLNKWKRDYDTTRTRNLSARSFDFDHGGQRVESTANGAFFRLSAAPTIKRDGLERSRILWIDQLAETGGNANMPARHSPDTLPSVKRVSAASAVLTSRSSSSWNSP